MGTAKLFPWRRRWELSLKCLLQCQRITRRCLFNEDYPFCSLNLSFRIHISFPIIRNALTTVKELQVLWGIFKPSQVRTAFQCSDWTQLSLSFISMSYRISVSEVVLHMHYVEWYYLETKLRYFTVAYS